MKKQPYITPNMRVAELEAERDVLLTLSTEGVQEFKVDEEAGVREEQHFGNGHSLWDNEW